MSNVPYAFDVGCLMYVMVYIRLDLTQVVIQVCKFMSKSGKRYWETLKWFFMYLKGRTSHDMFSNEKGDSQVVGYVNLEYTGDVYYRTSTTVYPFTLVWGPICWKSLVQSMVVMLTTEVE